MDSIAQWAARHGISAVAMADLYSMFEPPVRPDASGSEMGVQQRLRVEAPKFGNSLWRNNVGAARDETDRVIRYGLGNDSKPLNLVWKSSDLIGISTFIISPADVGRSVGIFTAVEVKEPGWKGVRDDHERAQAAFLQTVVKKGGIGMFATHTDDYLRGIGRCSV